jgi:hypothetical protein
MCIDSKRQLIYVFGGRIIVPTSEIHKQGDKETFSGLYVYDIEKKTWKLLRDKEQNNIKNGLQLILRSGHSMIYLEEGNSLLITGGSKFKENLKFFFFFFFKLLINKK